MKTDTATAPLLITGGRVMAPGADPHRPATADILIEDGAIVAVGPDLCAGGRDAPRHPPDRRARPPRRAGLRERALPLA
jgi:predicted amidohydrolase YtcJ